MTFFILVNVLGALRKRTAVKSSGHERILLWNYKLNNREKSCETETIALAFTLANDHDTFVSNDHEPFRKLISFSLF